MERLTNITLETSVRRGDQYWKFFVRGTLTYLSLFFLAAVCAQAAINGPWH